MRRTFVNMRREFVVLAQIRSENVFSYPTARW
jgi:hypothetical protein